MQVALGVWETRMTAQTVRFDKLVCLFTASNENFLFKVDNPNNHWTKWEKFQQTKKLNTWKKNWKFSLLIGSMSIRQQKNKPLIKAREMYARNGSICLFEEWTELYLDRGVNVRG